QMSFTNQFPFRSIRFFECTCQVMIRITGTPVWVASFAQAMMEPARDQGLSVAATPEAPATGDSARRPPVRTRLPEQRAPRGPPPAAGISRDEECDRNPDKPRYSPRPPCGTSD